MPRDQAKPLALEVELHRAPGDPDRLVGTAAYRRLLPGCSLAVVVLPQGALGNDDVVRGMAVELVEASLVLRSPRGRHPLHGVVDLERDGRSEPVLLGNLV